MCGFLNDIVRREVIVQGAVLQAHLPVLARVLTARPASAPEMGAAGIRIAGIVGTVGASASDLCQDLDVPTTNA
jgi:hypothetical protein